MDQARVCSGRTIPLSCSFLTQTRGRCTGRQALESASLRSAPGASNGSSRERVVVIFGQFVWALREFRR